MRYGKKKRKRPKSPARLQKEETDRWCSRYVRLQAVIAFGQDPSLRLGRCYTCGKVKDVAYMDSGHFKSRSLGGSSGLYFDVRAIRLQCKQCNGCEQGRPAEFTANLIAEAERNGQDGEALIVELEKLHKVRSYNQKDIIGLGLYFRAEVERMIEEYGLEKWWRR